MTRGRGWSRRAVVTAAAVLAALVSCSKSHPRPAASTPTSGPVVIASFNFEESELVAEIYAQALEHAGIPVRRELDLGPRELVLPAVHQGLVDLVPEYTGSLLAALDPGAHLQGATALEERAALVLVLSSWNVEVLAAAAGEDQNGLVVSATLAHRLGVTTDSDLAAVAPRLTLAAPSECPTRPFCLVGFQSVYGIHFGRFVPFDAESQRITALDQQVADVAVLDTTDGVLATGDFVLLTDDRHLQPTDDIAPIVSDRAVGAYGDRLVAALDAVSAKLTTPELIFLNWRVGVAGKNLASEARGWLQRQGLVPRG